MVLNISVPDEIYAKYVGMNPQNPHKAIQKQLERFSDVRPGDRAIVVTGDDLSEVQRAAQRSVETPKDIVKLIEEALKVKSEDVEVSLTEGQRNRLRAEASFWGKAPGEYASNALKEAMASRFGV
jgi:hypothetical protein